MAGKNKLFPPYCWVQGGHTKMRTPPSLINQKQTLFQKPDPRKTRSKLKNKKLKKHCEEQKLIS